LFLQETCTDYKGISGNIFPFPARIHYEPQVATLAVAFRPWSLLPALSSPIRGLW